MQAGSMSLAGTKCEVSSPGKQGKRDVESVSTYICTKSIYSTWLQVAHACGLAAGVLCCNLNVSICTPRAKGLLACDTSSTSSFGPVYPKEIKRVVGISWAVGHVRRGGTGLRNARRILYAVVQQMR